MTPSERQTPVANAGPPESTRRSRMPTVVVVGLTLLAAFVIGAAVTFASEFAMRLVLSTTFALLGLLAVRISLSVYQDAFSPLSIYVGTWCVMFSLFSLELVEYIDISLQAWLVLLGSVGSFVLGCLIATAARLSSQGHIPEVPERVLPDTQRLRNAIVFLFSLAMLGSALNVLRNVRIFGWQGVLLKPFQIRIAISEGEIRELAQPLTFLNEVVFIACAFFYFAYPEKRRPIIAIMPICSFLYLLMTTGRTRPIFALAAAFGVWIVVTGTRRLSGRVVFRVAAAGLIFLVVFNGFANWLGKTYENSEIYRLDVVRFEWGAPVFAMPYTYLTGNVAGFASMMEYGPDWTYGSASFRPALRLLQVLDSSIQVQQSVEEFVRIPFRFNTGTWLSTFYRDFGVSGVLIAPFILGLLTTFLYLQIRKRITFFTTFWWGVLFFGLVNSVFVNQITQPAGIYITLVGFLLGLSTRLSSRPQSELGVNA